MHLSSHSVGSHHGIIAKHSLFVLKIPSVHVTVKVSQWKSTNNKLSLFSFIFLFFLPSSGGNCFLYINKPLCPQALTAIIWSHSTCCRDNFGGNCWDDCQLEARCGSFIWTHHSLPSAFCFTYQRKLCIHQIMSSATGLVYRQASAVAWSRRRQRA